MHTYARFVPQTAAPWAGSTYELHVTDYDKKAKRFRQAQELRGKSTRVPAPSHTNALLLTQSAGVKGKYDQSTTNSFARSYKGRGNYYEPCRE